MLIAFETALLINLNLGYSDIQIALEPYHFSAYAMVQEIRRFSREMERYKGSIASHENFITRYNLDLILEWNRNKME